MRRLLPALVGAVLLVGCGTSAVTGTPSNTAPASVPEPTDVYIPAIDAYSSLIPLGLDASGALVVPPVDQPMQAGYYAGPDPAAVGDEVLPGEVGPAVIVAHVDGVIDGRKGQPGLFYKLHTLAPGDEVIVGRADGSELRFVVERVERHPKTDFPTAEVYGDTDRPELRLITCGGSFDRSARSYRDNVIVWAVLA